MRPSTLEKEHIQSTEYFCLYWMGFARLVHAILGDNTEESCAISSDNSPQICTEQNEHSRVCLMANIFDLHHVHS